MSGSLNTIDVLAGAVRAAGILELEDTPGGIVLHRMPSWARSQHNDIALALVETMPSGARLEMTTDATCIELDVQLTHVQMGAEPGMPACFDLVIDGQLADENTTRDGTLVIVDPMTGAVDIEPGGPTTIRYTGLPAGAKRVEVWLPQGAAVHLIELRADGAVSATAASARTWVHYGSSISHCMEATRPTGAWPAVAARLAGVDLQSFAFAGQCQLDPFVGRMIAAHPADLVSLKLGINVVNGDTMRERTFVPAVHGLLDTIRDGHPTVPVVVITPITCPAAEDHPGPTTRGPGGETEVVARSPELAIGALTLRRIRELETQIIEDRQRDDPNLHLLPGPELFGSADLDDLPDGLHPNAAGYQRMGERFHAWAFENGPFG